MEFRRGQVPMVRAAGSRQDFTNIRRETLASRYGSLATKQKHNAAPHLFVRVADLPVGCINDGNTDYPGAINCMVDPQNFDCNLVADKVPCTYEDATWPIDYPMDFVVIHDIEGTAREAINIFHNVHSAVSTHYIVDSDGTVYQILREHDIAYHAGNYWYNQRALGIENAGYAARGHQWYNATQYQATARLTAYLLNKYGIPLDRGHVIGHGNIPSPSLALMPNYVDPGPYWLWDYYFYLINRYGIPYTSGALDADIITVHPATDQLPLGSGGQELPQNYNYFPLYNGPSTASGRFLMPETIHSSMKRAMLSQASVMPIPALLVIRLVVVIACIRSGMVQRLICMIRIRVILPVHARSGSLLDRQLSPMELVMLYSLNTTTKIYGRPTANDDYPDR